VKKVQLTVRSGGLNGIRIVVNNVPQVDDGADVREFDRIFSGQEETHDDIITRVLNRAIRMSVSDTVREALSSRSKAKLLMSVDDLVSEALKMRGWM